METVLSAIERSQQGELLQKPTKLKSKQLKPAPPSQMNSNPQKVVYNKSNKMLMGPELIQSAF
jgi:hypothetical protein